MLLAGGAHEAAEGVHAPASGQGPAADIRFPERCGVSMPRNAWADLAPDCELAQ
jgi:hypothetical protein